MENDILEQLKVVYGKKVAKKLLKKVEKIKKENPNIAYNFIFTEDGQVIAQKKES